MADGRSCPMLKNCTFIEFQRDESEIIRHAWMTTYCFDNEHSKECKRRLYNENTGETPPDNMSPIGTML